MRASGRSVPGPTSTPSTADAAPGGRQDRAAGLLRAGAGKPRIAAVEGFCVGGGIELACWCDLRIAGEGAEFGALNRQVGVPWVDGGTQRMTRVVGQGNALYLIETGERIGGADRVLPAAEPAGRPQGRAGVVGAFAGGGVGPGVSSGPGGRGRSRARGRHQVLRAARARMRTATRPAPFIPETPRAAPRQTGVRHSSDTDLGRRRPRGRLHACNTAGSSTGGPGICRRAPIMPVPGRLGENAWGDRWYSTPPSHPSRW